MSETRRTILKVLTGVFGGGASALVGGPAIRALVSPVSKDTVLGAHQFVRVAAFDAVPQDGTPLEVPVRLTSTTDAWAKMPPAEVGTVLLRRENKEVIAFTTVCPHLGCGVRYAKDQKQFTCPCHDSAFALDGGVATGPSPRPLDRLPCRVVDGGVEVKYQRFKSGIDTKVGV